MGDANARVCIDFGTALSKASGFAPEGGSLRQSVRPLPIGERHGSDNPFLTPSVVFVDAGRIMFGPSAFARAKEKLAAGRDPVVSFKSILAARDVDQALTLKVKPSIDPTGTLLNRDVFILYLAYLDQLIRQTIAADPNLPPALADAPRRYTNSIWRAGNRADRALARLFDESAPLSERLGLQLSDAEGVSIAQAKDGLERARETPDRGYLEAGVFEAHAAAAAFIAFAPKPPAMLMVVDIGGGTTDIAAFSLSGDGEDRDLLELEGARQVSSLAGDEIDTALIELVLRKARPKDDDHSERAWRALKLNIRAHKRELFAQGKCTIVFGQKRVSVRRDEFLNDALFKQFCGALHDNIAQSLKAALAGHGPGERTILLAGGGAHLQFVRDIANAVAERAKGEKVSVERLGDGWSTRLDADPALASVLPQTAISMGGALARLTEATTA